MCNEEIEKASNAINFMWNRSLFHFDSKPMHHESNPHNYYNWALFPIKLMQKFFSSDSGQKLCSKVKKIYDWNNFQEEEERTSSTAIWSIRAATLIHEMDDSSSS